MNRPFLTKKHLIIEISAMAFVIISLIIAIVLCVTIDGDIPTSFTMSGEIREYGSPTVLLIMPITMLLINVMMSLLLHFLPTGGWNIPFKVNPEREVFVFAEVAYMIESIELVFGLMSLLFVSLYMLGGTATLVSVNACVALMFVLIAVFGIRSKKANG